MKKLILLFIVVVSIISTEKVEAQEILDGIYVKQHVPAREPIPYYDLREADVMWSKKIWRIMDLKEKINHPYYYPVIPQDNRMSLMSLVLSGVENGELTVYSPTAQEFTEPMTWSELELKFDAGLDTVMVPDLETGELIENIVTKEVHPEEALEVMIKEEWFFDRQKSRLDVRIIGFCPIRKYVKELEGIDMGDDQELTKSKACWVYFPEVRHLLANHEVFNPYNDAERRTFDDMFFKRKFSSYVSTKTNVYDNRRINQYKQGLDAQLEAEKIKNWIFTTEHDLWHY